MGNDDLINDGDVSASYVDKSQAPEDQQVLHGVRRFLFFLVYFWVKFFGYPLTFEDPTLKPYVGLTHFGPIFKVALAIRNFNEISCGAGKKRPKLERSSQFV